MGLLTRILISDSTLVIRSAKGGKDRFVSIPCSLVTELQAQIAVASALAESDRINRIPVKLPGLLATKYPNSQYSPRWAWLFPSHQPCIDPRTNKTVRWRCHEANVQRAVKATAAPLGLEITPHHLRHAYATHCLESGSNVRAIQVAMGHEQLETTMGSSGLPFRTTLP